VTFSTFVTPTRDMDWGAYLALALSLRPARRSGTLS
jgi:hypothetical protein